MTKLFALLSVAGVMMLGAPRVAHADDRDDRYDDHHHGAAPEPLTVIGLALGAGAIGVARLVSKRKPKSP